MSTAAARQAIATFPTGGKAGDRYQTPEDDRRRATMEAAWDAYDGKFKKPLAVVPGETDDNVISNRCAPIVDTGLQYLVGESVTIEVERASEEADTGGAEPPSEVGSGDDADGAAGPAPPGLGAKPKPKAGPSPGQLRLGGWWGD